MTDKEFEFRIERNNLSKFFRNLLKKKGFESFVGFVEMKGLGPGFLVAIIDNHDRNCVDFYRFLKVEEVKAILSDEAKLWRFLK